MSDTTISRRAFLQGSGAVLMGTLAATSGAIALFAPSRSWALELAHLDEHQGKVLLQLTRHIYPHKSLDDAVYALVVKDLDTAAAESEQRKILADGVKSLDKASGGDWLAASESDQSTQVKAMSDSPMFQTVRGTAVVSLYNNDMAFAHFGYPGAQGGSGYLHRGFNDLAWLPAPPAPASGPMPAQA